MSDEATKTPNSSQAALYDGSTAFEISLASNWATSGHLRRGSDVETTKKGFSRTNDASILSWPTIMGL
eukprot:scaffold10854_cov155-Skeletonema_dohrnii-CCMP3373.AAC.22